MDIKDAYNNWAYQYDTNKNKTRDLEAFALRKTLDNHTFKNCLEIGCGTGKNTGWLSNRAGKVTAIDFSEEMLLKAKEKISSERVEFRQADINRHWDFASSKYELISFSLVLEHIEDLDQIFLKASNLLVENGLIYIGELHPFKQHTGSKARFGTEEGRQTLTCHLHNVSDFTGAAKKNGLEIVLVDEFFDNDDHSQIPRILTLLFRKKTV